MENGVDTENTSENTSSLKVESDYIDFGCLKPGEGVNTILGVSGGPGEVLVHCDQLDVTPCNFDYEDTKLNVVLKPSSGGELIWSNILFKSQDSEIEVLVIARWEGTAPEPMVNKQPTTSPTMAIDTSSSKNISSFSRSERPRKGRSCPHCHKNFAYDSSTHQWEECTCNQIQIMMNVSSYIFRELRCGIKEFPSYIREIWQVIIGKENW